MFPCNPYGELITKKFNEVFDSSSTFTSGFKASAFKGAVTDDSLTQIYYLMLAKYGNSQLANNDEEQFKNKVYATIWQYGPTWEKNLKIQSDLRNLSETELLTGAKQINDHAYNPSTTVENGPNSVDGEISTINEQTKTRYTKSKMDAYEMLMGLLRKDVTEEFLVKFKRLFVIVVVPQDLVENLNNPLRDFLFDMYTVASGNASFFTNYTDNKVSEVETTLKAYADNIETTLKAYVDTKIGDIDTLLTALDSGTGV